MRIEWQALDDATAVMRHTPICVDLGQVHGHERDDKVSPSNALQNAGHANGLEIKPTEPHTGEVIPACAHSHACVTHCAKSYVTTVSLTLCGQSNDEQLGRAHENLLPQIRLLQEQRKFAHTHAQNWQ